MSDDRRWCSIDRSYMACTFAFAVSIPDSPDILHGSAVTAVAQADCAGCRDGTNGKRLGCFVLVLLVSLSGLFLGLMSFTCPRYRQRPGQELNPAPPVRRRPMARESQQIPPDVSICIRQVTATDQDQVHIRTRLHIYTIYLRHHQDLGI